MAIEKQQILDLLGKEGENDAKAESLLEVFKADVEAQLNAILVNKEQIIAEKRDEVAKRRNLESELEKQKEQYAVLQEQLKNNSPDDVKKIYEARLTDQQSIYEKKISEIAAKLEEEQGRVNELKLSQRKLECLEAFNKLVADKNIAADSLNDFADFVLGPDCCKFDYRPIGDGKTILATSNGLTIDAAVKAALETSFGKRCVVTNTTGGGAGGASGSGVPDVNPFKKETFNLTKQSEIFQKDPALAAQLQSQARG